MLKKSWTRFCNREDVQAVMNILGKRLHTPFPDRMAMRMENEKGRTRTGLIIWNIGTLLQDYPNTFLLAGFVVLFGLSAMIWQWTTQW